MAPHQQAKYFNGSYQNPQMQHYHQQQSTQSMPNSFNTFAPTTDTDNMKPLNGHLHMHHQNHQHQHAQRHLVAPNDLSYPNYANGSLLMNNQMGSSGGFSNTGYHAASSMTVQPSHGNKLSPTIAQFDATATAPSYSTPIYPYSNLVNQNVQWW